MSSLLTIVQALHISSFDKYVPIVSIFKSLLSFFECPYVYGSVYNIFLVIFFILFDPFTFIIVIDEFVHCSNFNFLSNFSTTSNFIFISF